jgi:hypothetical protein
VSYLITAAGHSKAGKAWKWVEIGDTSPIFLFYAAIFMTFRTVRKYLDTPRGKVETENSWITQCFSLIHGIPTGAQGNG